MQLADLPIQPFVQRCNAETSEDGPKMQVISEGGKEESGERLEKNPKRPKVAEVGEGGDGMQPRRTNPKRPKVAEVGEARQGARSPETCIGRSEGFG